MAEKSKTKHLLITPKGTFAYTWLDKPDEFKGTKKFKATVKIEKGEDVEWWLDGEKHTGTTEDFVKFVTDIHVRFGGKKLKKNPIKDGNKNTDDDGNVREGFEGVVYIQGNSQYKPKKVDAKGNEIPRTPIYGGDVGRLALILSKYDEGASSKLSAVRLLEKNNTGGGGNAFSMVGEEDGYEADEDQEDSDVNEDVEDTNEDDEDDY